MSSPSKHCARPQAMAIRRRSPAESCEANASGAVEAKEANDFLVGVWDGLGF